MDNIKCESVAQLPYPTSYNGGRDKSKGAAQTVAPFLLLAEKVHPSTKIPAQAKLERGNLQTNFGLTDHRDYFLRPGSSSGLM
jgi:hypothetical protein